MVCRAQQVAENHAGGARYLVGVHLVGGIVGSLAIGFLGTKRVNSAGLNGIFYGGGADLLGKQALGVVSVLAYSFCVTLVIGLVIHKTIGFRISEEEEVGGIDLAEHLESAYELLSGAGSVVSRSKASSHEDAEVTA